MKVLPDMKTVQENAATGRYDILPVSCEILSDICTPIEALKILKKCIHTLLSVGICCGKGKVGAQDKTAKLRELRGDL